MTRILVGYASKHNSTAEIARVIGDELCQHDALQVDVFPVRAVRDVDGYDAVVLGSAVYGGSWRPEAAAFLIEQQGKLAQRPVWMFSSGPIGSGDEAVGMTNLNLPHVLKPYADRISPREIVVFQGNFDPDVLNVYERFLLSGKNGIGADAPTGDFRDWEAIREWANRIAQALLVPASET